MTRRDKCYFVGRRALTLTPEQAAWAWYELAVALEHDFSEMDIPKFRHLLRTIRQCTICAKMGTGIPVKPKGRAKRPAEPSAGGSALAPSLPSLTSSTASRNTSNTTARNTNIEAKAIRAQVERNLMAFRRADVGPSAPDPIETLAAAHRLLSPRKRAKKPALKGPSQTDLFNP